MTLKTSILKIERSIFFNIPCYKRHCTARSTGFLMTSESTNILMIDDDASFKKLVEMRLKSFMPVISFTSFGTLTEARTFLAAEPELAFDLVILDEHLPDGRGADFLAEGWFESIAVLSVSSDTAPEIPGRTLKAGATYFLSKTSISDPLFRPLVLGIIDGNKLRRELLKSKLNSTIISTVKTLVSTLRHEINNPLGAVLGAAYLLRNHPGTSKEQREAAELVESSGKRIKHVLEQLSSAMAVESVSKSDQNVFHIPGDSPWEDGSQSPEKGTSEKNSSYQKK